MNDGKALMYQGVADNLKVVEAQFGVPVGNCTGFVHKVDLATENPLTGRIGARWNCGNTSAKVELFQEVPPGRSKCSRCFIEKEYQQFVYFIRKDGLVKIGWTSDLHRRVYEIGGELLAAQPGTRQVEETLHRVFRKTHHHGEWFRPSSELMEYIDLVAQGPPRVP